MPRVKNKKIVPKSRPNLLAVTTTRRPSRATGSLSLLSLMQKIQGELKLSQSYLSLFLGILIVLVVVILVFNYFKKNEAALGPSGQTVAENTQAQEDVKPDSLPGKYTVKDGDTLFSIAATYYSDGYKYSELVKVNKIADENTINVGQVLDIPKLDTAQPAGEGTGGAVNSTVWGDKIEGDTYTVVEGDWLSTIAGRAYGNIMAFDKIAKANNISDPNVIEPDTVLKIPRS